MLRRGIGREQLSARVPRRAIVGPPFFRRDVSGGLTEAKRGETEGADRIESFGRA